MIVQRFIIINEWGSRKLVNEMLRTRTTRLISSHQGHYNGPQEGINSYDDQDHLEGDSAGNYLPPKPSPYPSPQPFRHVENQRAEVHHYQHKTVPFSNKMDPHSTDLIDIPDFAGSKGVFRESENDDIRVMVDNFTAPALAMALRDREATLQLAAILAQNEDLTRLHKLLQPFTASNVDKRRIRNHGLDLSKGFTRKELVIIQRYLHRMPRHVFQATSSRASVIIPLCNVSGVASILFERRSSKVRTHKHQVCFPGGMLDEGIDTSIVQTSLREMEEELGIPKEKIEVLGILRCNWNEVANMTGIAVTPVVGFIGEINNLKFFPNSDEVEEYFTVSIDDLVDEQKWLARNFSTPMFTGGPHNIWGLTGYLLERFVRDVLLKCTVQ